MSELVFTSSDEGTGILRFSLKVLKFIIISYILSIGLLAALAALIVYTDVPGSVSDTATMSISLFGAFVSAFLAGRHISSKGYLMGICVGAVNIFLLLIIGTAVLRSPLFTVSNLSHIVMGALFGAFGGIIGVNFGNN